MDNYNYTENNSEEGIEGAAAVAKAGVERLAQEKRREERLQKLEERTIILRNRMERFGCAYLKQSIISFFAGEDSQAKRKHEKIKNIYKETVKRYNKTFDEYIVLGGEKIGFFYCSPIGIRLGDDNTSFSGL